MTKPVQETKVVTPSSGDSGPRMPRHEVWLDLPDYPGFQVKAWVNAPQRVFLDLDSGDAERIGSAVRALIIETNDWCDCDGDPLPAPDDPTFLDAVPTELLAMALVAIRRDGAGILPNLAARNKAR